MRDALATLVTLQPSSVATQEFLMITKLKWQWQSSANTHDVRSTHSTQPLTTHQRGRVITGMLTGGDEFQDPAKSKGRGY
jgi:hypothetical protein